MAKSWTQQVITKLVSPTKADSMEAASRLWMVRCHSCGFEQSIWDMGGIRWNAKGSSWTLRRCSDCGKRGGHTIYRREPTGTPHNQQSV
jgi:hypothetical protein